MSVQALSWAYGVTTGSGTRKAILLALANCHNHHTGKCCPHVERIAEETEFSERTVRTALDDLVADGIVDRTG